MKNLILIFAIFLIQFHCQAQTEKGSFQLGLGGLPIIYPDNSSETGYSLRANIGYFPVNRWSIGIMPFYGKVEYLDAYGAGIYSRYYILSKRTSIFMEVGVGLGNVRYEHSPHINGTMTSFNLGPGINYIFKNQLSIELIVQYARFRNISHPETTLVGNTFIPTLGIQYYISK